MYLDCSVTPTLLQRDRFVGLMEKHGFVVLTETGAIRDAYLEFMELLKAFFDSDSDWKESCKGGVHFNERGIPMVRPYVSMPTSQNISALFLCPVARRVALSLHAGWACPLTQRSVRSTRYFIVVVEMHLKLGQTLLP